MATNNTATHGDSEDALVAKLKQAALQKKECHRWNEYNGTMEELVSAGLASPDQFPGQPARNKSSCTYYDGMPARKGRTVGGTSRGVCLSITRSGARFILRAGFSEEEQKTRTDAAKKAEVLHSVADELRRKRAQQAAVSANFSGTTTPPLVLRKGFEFTAPTEPKTVAEFRSHKEEMAHYAYNVMWYLVIARAAGPYRFKPSKEQESCLQDICSSLLELTDEIKVIRDRRREEEQRTAAARRDKKFSGFLEEVLTPVSANDESET